VLSLSGSWKTCPDLRGQLCGILGSSLGSLPLPESFFEHTLRIVPVVVCQHALGCRSTAREYDAV
jgi:hypothetical protein